MNRIASLAVACLAILLQDAPSQGSSKWLVIAASKSEVVPVIAVIRDLRNSWPAANIVASSDCTSLRPGLYLAVAEIAPTRADADGALKKLRAEVPDAYVRECSPKPNSTLAFGIPLIDPSIADVPPDVVNWSDSDRVSSVQKLPERGYLWIRRKYVPNSNDLLEGQRISVIYFDRKPQNGVELQSDCDDFKPAQLGTLLALDCAQEVAGDQLFHETIVFETPSGTRIKSIRRCREPVFNSDTYLTCKEEHVGAQNKLKLVPRRVPLR